MLQVIVGILTNSKKEILITQRPLHKPYSGYWEFPGGKREADEPAYQTLVRELKEELDLEIHAAEPWKKLTYTYPEKIVELDIWLVTQFSREPRGMEEQAIQWVGLDHLNQIDFLPANKLILAEIVRLFA